MNLGADSAMYFGPSRVWKPLEVLQNQRMQAVRLHACQRRELVEANLSQQRWRNEVPRALQGVLLVRGLGEFFLEELRPAHLERWHADVTDRLIDTGIYKPTTCNSWRGVLRVVLRHAQRRLGLTQDLANSVPIFDTREHDPYPAEEPNALPPERIAAFLTTLRRMYPQF